MAAERYGRRHSRFSRGHQGPADYAGRRWHSFAERRAAPDSRSLFLRTPGALFRRSSLPVKHPEKLDVFIFRENTEDVYIGIEWKSGSPEAKKLLEFLNNDMLKDGKKQIRWDSGVGIKPISPTGTKRLVRRAIKYALANKKKSVTLVHK